MRFKISIVGAGNVGANLAQRLAERDYADIVLVDIVDGLAEGKALDLLEAGPVLGYESMVSGGTGYAATTGSDILVITGGIARKPGMSRDDLLGINAGIVAGVVRQAAELSPRAVIVMVSNPLDAMAQVAMMVSGFPRERVVGMAGVLDTARFRTFVAQELGASVHDVRAYVLGGHGDTMVPLLHRSNVSGIPVDELIPADRLGQIVQRTRDGGAEIVSLLKTGSAFYAPSAAVAQMIDSILLDTRKILPCSVYLQGEYGISGVFTGVPVRLGDGGVQEVIPMDLSSEDQAALARSAQSVRDLLQVIERDREKIDPGLPPLLGVPA